MKKSRTSFLLAIKPNFLNKTLDIKKKVFLFSTYINYDILIYFILPMRERNSEIKWKIELKNTVLINLFG